MRTLKAWNYKYNLAQIGLILFAFVIPFQRLFSFPLVKYKFQLPEMVFILLCIVFPIYYKPKLKIHVTAVAVLLFAAWSLLSIIFNFSKPAILEGIGICYLVFVGIITSQMVAASGMDFLITLLRFFVFGVVVNCLLSFFGLVLLTFGIENQMGFLYTDYPIIGSVFRMQGFTSHPIMLSTLAISALLITQSVFGKYRRLISVILLFGIGLTFTKSILSGLAAVLLVYHNKLFSQRGYSLIFMWIIIICILVTKEYLTHFTIPLTELQAEKLKSTPYWGGDIKTPINDQYSIYNTIYHQLKEASLKAFFENPLTGVGGGSSNLYNLQKIPAQLLPDSIKYYDPHSSLFGILAEFGIIGFTLFALAVFSLLSIIRHLQRVVDSKIIYALLAIFVFILFESLSADVVNYRHLWLMTGIAYGIYASRNEKMVFLNSPKRT